MRRGSDRFLASFGEYLKKETGLDLEQANVKAGELLDVARGAAEKGRAVVDRFRLELVPVFIEWNKWEYWKVPFFFSKFVSFFK